MDCNKESFETFEKASKVVKLSRSFKKNRSKVKVVKLKPYKCPDCGNWHLTGQK